MCNYGYISIRYNLNETNFCIGYNSDIHQCLYTSKPYIEYYNGTLFVHYFDNSDSTKNGYYFYITNVTNFNNNKCDLNNGVYIGRMNLGFIMDLLHF